MFGCCVMSSVVQAAVVFSGQGELTVPVARDFRRVSNAVLLAKFS